MLHPAILTNARLSASRGQRPDVGDQSRTACLRVAAIRSIRYRRTMARVQIRLARLGECSALAEMRYRFRSETEPAMETKSRFVRRCTSWMRKRFRSGSYPWRCWVAEDDERLLGNVCVQLVEKIPNPVNEPELHAYLTNFYVVPEMRDHGLGKRLLNKALSWCRTREIDAVILWATLASRSLYRRCGLVEPSDIFELRRSVRRAHRVGGQAPAETFKEKSLQK
jgi:GNAT superfamily N-acetyltransferase